MGKTINLQEQFLDRLQQEQKPVTVIVLTGFQMRGIITGHGQFTIEMNVDGKRQLVYKHAISTIKEG